MGCPYLNRRGFLKLAGTAGVAAVALPGLAGAKPEADSPGLLIDTTLCRGCRACEAACTEQNQQPPPEKCGDRSVFGADRDLGPERYTVVNMKGDAAHQVFVKRQCMHCLEPACASACLARALDKTPEGPVIYHPERCIGCRYCMVACPFEIPKFEYQSAAPYIRKCQFCFSRQKEGKQPACASVCPSGALKFGRREELLEEAKTRIYQNPDKYVHHVYGEHEAGGTSVLYLSSVPFESLGLPDVGTRGYPELTRGALGTVPFVMTLWPPLLMGLYAFRNRKPEQPATPDQEEHHE